MKSSIRRQTQNLFRKAMLPVCRMLLLGLLFSPTAFLDAEAEAAQLSFNPTEASVELAPGESKTVPVKVILEGATFMDSIVKFSISREGGSFPDQGDSSPVVRQLDGIISSLSTAIPIAAPAGTPSGNYTAIYETQIVMGGSVSPGRLTVNISINGGTSCAKVPEFTEIKASQNMIQTRNNEPVMVDFSGTVATSAGCSTDKVWYSLTDEYGELDGTGEIDLGEDGSFTVSVPMVASRKGTDKDGRLYILDFMASNEAGVSQRHETRIVVSHDNRGK